MLSSPLGRGKGSPVAGFLFDHALLPEGWAASVEVDVEDGTIVDVRPGASANGRERVARIALPGLPNLHSHTFQRAMAGLAETRGPATDNFWSWREVMYRFLGALTPDDVEAVAAYAFAEMLEGGFTWVASSTTCITTLTAARSRRSARWRAGSPRRRPRPGSG